MIKKIIALFFLLYMSLALYSYQWPIAGGFLTASFGDSDSGSFLKGIRLSGHGSVVSPFLDGELIYYSDEDNDLFSVNGNTMVLQHDNGYRSIYSHLEKTYKEPDKFFFSMNDQIGIVGNSGRLSENSLFFMLYDTLKKQYLNPQFFLPPSGDNNPPEILNVYFLKNNNSNKLSSSNTLAQGKVEIIAEIVDYGGVSHDSIRMVPHSVSVFYLGNEINLIRFDTIKKENGQLIMEGGDTFLFDKLYKSEKLLFLGELNLKPGVGFLEIAASDISKNISNRTFKLMVIE